MKKLLTISLLALLLAACGDEETKDTNDSTDTTEENSQIEVDKGLLNVEVTIPEDYFMGQSQEDIKANAEEQGAKDIVFNDDGSVTYTLSKSDHKKVLDEMKKAIDESITELENSEEYPSIKKVEANKDFTKLDLTVDRQQFEEGMDSFALLGVALLSSYYQIYQGVAEEDIDLEINYIDAATGDVFEAEDMGDTTTD